MTSFVGRQAIAADREMTARRARPLERARIINQWLDQRGSACGGAPRAAH
jgi:hypothetical protein